MLGKIKKEDIFFGDSVYYIDDFKGNINDVVALENNKSFVIDHEHALLIKDGDYYIDITYMQSYFEYKGVKKSDNHIYKNKCISADVMHRLLETDCNFSGLSIIKKDNLIAYDDAIAEYYGVMPKREEYLTFNECKKISRRCTKEHDGMEDVVKEYMYKMR